jgi:hypothetical protein
MDEKKESGSKEKTESKWESIKEAQELLHDVRQTNASLIKIPDKIDLRLKNGFLFGLIMGIGFCIGFLVSLMILFGSISFYVYAKFPQLFK